MSFSFQRNLFVVALYLSTTLGCVSAAKQASPQAEAPSQAAAQPQALDVQGQAALQQILSSARQPELRWPDFAPYQAEVKEFYTRTGGTLGWVRDRKPTPQALAMITLLEQSDKKGLSPEDYDASRWPTRVQGLSGANDVALANFDTALTVSAMRYIRALHVGRVNPKAVGLQMDVTSRKYDLGEFLYTQVIHASDVPAVVLSVEPKFPGYLRTAQALERYKAFAEQQPEQKPLAVPAKPIAPGQEYADLPGLVQHLKLVGDMPADAPANPNPTLYQGAAVEAVKAYQLRHGQTPDGKIDAQMVREMNVPYAQRVRQIELALERWRWMEHSFPQPPVVVNLPEFKLRAYSDDYKIELYKTVIVGKAYGHRSPVFEKEMKYVVFRPYWLVTPTIQRAEVVPHVQKDRGYIGKKNFEVVTPDGKVVTDSVVSDEVLAQLKAGKLRVRQKPGANNSLGLVKLIFPNEDNVYLHGTEAPQLFANERRDLSHGCIRVQQPADLAAWALRHNDGWDLERVKATMNGKEDNITVNLSHPIPVLIVYGTVAVDEQGKVFFFDDIYGYDKVLDAALNKGYPYPTK